MSTPTLADRIPADPTDPDALYEAFTGWADRPGPRALPAPGRGAARAGHGRARDPVDADGVREVARRGRRALRRAGPGPPHLLHGPDQGAGQREVLRARRRVRRRQRRHDDRRLRRQPATPRSSAARPRSSPTSRCATGDDADVGQVVMDEFHFYADPQRGWAWQVPLLELPQVAVRADVGDARRRRLLRGGPDAPHRPARRGHRRRRAPRAADVHLRDDAAARDSSTSWSKTRRAPVYVVHFTQTAAVERAQSLLSTPARQPRAAGPRSPRRSAGFRFGAGLRQDAQPAAAARHRRAPRGHAAQVPPARRAARAARACSRDLRHRHARRRHQRADPHGAAHQPGQVRRREDAAPDRARVPPDRRARRPRGLRHRGRGRRPGARARDREPQARSRRPATTRRSCKKIVRKKAPEGHVNWTDETFERLRRRRARAADQPSFAVTHAMVLNVLGRATGDAVAAHDAPAHRQPRAAGAAAPARPPRDRASTARCAPPASSSGRGSSDDDAARPPRLQPHRRPARRTSRSTSRSRRSRSRRSTCSTASDPTYALDVVSVIEATLDDPRQVLCRAAVQGPRRGGRAR